MIDKETKYINIYCDSIEDVFDTGIEILNGIYSHVDVKTRYLGRDIDVDDGQIRIEFRPANIGKTGGICPHYILFKTDNIEFIDMVNYSIKSKWGSIELNSVQELIDLVIGEKIEEKENDY